MTASSSSFDAAFGYSILNEGQIYTDDPADRGGPTRYGITQRTLSDFLGRTAPKEEVAQLTLETAKDIYRTNFWAPLDLDEVQPAVATAIFDVAILCGNNRAVRLTQKCLFLFVDGRLGPLTRRAVGRVTPSAFMPRIVPALSDHFFSIARKDATQARFLEGWIRRALRLLTLAPISIA